MEEGNAGPENKMRKGKKLMRILMVPSSYAPVIGGVQAVVRGLAYGLKKEGQTVLVVTQKYPRRLACHEMVDGIEVRRMLFLKPGALFLRKGRLDLLAASFFYYPVAISALSAIFRDFRPEIVNLHFAGAQAPFVLNMRRHFRFKLVVSLHGDDVEKFFDPLRADRNLEDLTRLLNEADRITVCSGYLLRRLSEIAPSAAEKTKVIHNGIDLEQYRDSAGFNHSRPYIFSCGRLVPKKGFDLLLQAFARVSVNRNVDLILAGDGEQKAALQNMAHELGIKNKVIFYGKAESSELLQLLNGSEFVVVPSRQEPFGLVALEAMAAGKYVAATRVGGLPEFLEGTQNALVEASVEGLAKALSEALADPGRNRAVGSQNREISRKWSTAAMVSGYASAYSDLK